MKNDPRSCERNLCNCIETWKGSNSIFARIIIRFIRSSYTIYVIYFIHIHEKPQESRTINSSSKSAPLIPTVLTNGFHAINVFLF